MRIRCEAPRCVRGVVHLPAGWGHACPVCGGSGFWSLAKLAGLLLENEETLRKLARGRQPMRVKTCQRVLDKVLRLQREMAIQE